MSDKTPEELQAEQAAMAAAAKSVKRKAQNVTPAHGFRTYASTEKHTVPFDIQIRNEMITGTWSAKDGIVEFLVPDHLVEGFEGHYHFVSNNVARSE